MSVIAIGLCVVAVGFFAGRAIGGDHGDAPGSATPTGISTRQSAIPVPTLGDEERLPTLAVKEQPPEQEEESVAEAGESSSPSIEAESPASSSEPEVTVAPNE